MFDFDHKRNFVNEGFKEQMKDKRNQTFSQKMNHDMHETVSVIRFECKELGHYLAEKLNGGKSITVNDAKTLEFKFNTAFFCDFEKTYKEFYTFNEFQFFEKVEFLKQDLWDRWASYAKCERMTEITFPENINDVADYALYQFKGLEKVNFLNKKIDSYGFESFYYCTKLKEIPLNDSLTFIADDAFNGCSSIESVILPDSVWGIGTNAFCDCMSLKEFRIPPSVKVLNIGTFSSSSITHLTIPDSVTSIKSQCFFQTNLEIIKIPDSVVELGEEAFGYCKTLKKVILSNKLKTIESLVFEGCSSLKSIDIPESVKKVNLKAFQGCTSLRTVIIHSKIDFSVDAFGDDKSIMKKINFYIPKDLYSYYAGPTSRLVKYVKKFLFI